jgi:integrase
MAILAECPRCHRKLALRHKVCTGKLKGGIPCEADLVKLKRSRKVRYWISYRVPGGKGKQRMESVGFSIEEARDAMGKKRGQKRENRIFDIKPDAKMTFRELADWYLDLERIKALAYYGILRIKLKNFNSEFGDMIVNQIKPVDLENFQAKRKADGLRDATIDQDVKAAQTMINKAFDNDLVSGDTLRTFKKVKKLLKRNANARDKILSFDQFHRLLGYLPKHTKAILTTGFYTGMRKGEILSLTWDKVDLENRLIRLEAKDTKDNEPRSAPICDELYAILISLPNRLHGSEGDNHVFQYKKKPIKDIRSALRRACREAGVLYGRFIKGGFVFHDLRHTFNTYARKAGVPESVIMEITGHSTREMFDRYNTVDTDDARQAIKQLEGYLQSVNQTVNQMPFSESSPLSRAKVTA